MHGLLKPGRKNFDSPWVSEAWQESPSSVHGSLKLRPRLNFCRSKRNPRPLSPGVPLVETYPFTSSPSWRWRDCPPFDIFSPADSRNRHTPYRLCHLVSRGFRPRCNASYSGFYLLLSISFEKEFFFFISGWKLSRTSRPGEQTQPARALTRFETRLLSFSRGSSTPDKAYPVVILLPLLSLSFSFSFPRRDFGAL